ncbi:hypothetical protein CDD82_833 [Ophiocordyceps australis]|uniref:Monopolin complex subunit Csm1/Pcs1 C-terminal domain-containing protein n=1 Tax=Ophiocordyceps australis TaxID=1399860 RepID=A0A2C5YH72_9HYPO|nr:hypothetical protein CDD82_833 [Ophiocordyceps australis]
MAPQVKKSGRLANLAASDSEPNLDGRNEPAVRGRRTGRGRGSSSVGRVTKASSTRSRRKVGRNAGGSGRTLEDKDESNDTINDAVHGRGKQGADVHPDLVQDDGPVASKTGRRKAGKSVRERNEVLLAQEEADSPDELSVLNVEADATDSGIARPEAGSTSLRRRLGELTRRYDNLTTRHGELRDVGVKAAERNFERFKKQVQESAAVSDKLIAQLKEEVAAQASLASQGEQVQREFELSRANSSQLQSQIDQLGIALSAARSEVETLSAKLAASRSAAESQAAKIPGSALKPGSTANRILQSTELLQAAQAKEDLYGDLTGLLVRGLKRDQSEEVFDCIQTGQNGTLHFKLLLQRGDNYEDAQFTYRPQLDEDRDGALIKVLPDYLLEEITFLRSQASKFYSRVTKSLTERIQ